MELGKIFDQEIVEGSFDLVPDGWYVATIQKAELKKTKDGTGSYLNIQYKLQNGRVVFGMVTISNKNADAEKIGEQQLGYIRGALGIKKLSNSDQLIGGNLEIKVATKPASGDYEASNIVKGWKSLVSSASVVDDTPPWAR